MTVEIVTQSSPELVEAMGRLIPQLSRTAPALTEEQVRTRALEALADETRRMLEAIGATDAGYLYEAAGLYVCQAGVAQGVVIVGRHGIPPPPQDVFPSGEPKASAYILATHIVHDTTRTRHL